jgi:hypothetical protein
MKELPEIYGNLFKSNVVSGIGSNSSTAGLAAGANGKVDPRKLSQAQYRELRAKNPESLDLGPKRRPKPLRGSQFVSQTKNTFRRRRE